MEFLVLKMQSVTYLFAMGRDIRPDDKPERFIYRSWSFHNSKFMHKKNESDENPIIIWV